MGSPGKANKRFSLKSGANFDIFGSCNISWLLNAKNNQSILASFWRPSWTPKSDMLAPRGEDVVYKVTFEGFGRDVKK